MGVDTLGVRLLLGWGVPPASGGLGVAWDSSSPLLETVRGLSPSPQAQHPPTPHQLSGEQNPESQPFLQLHGMHSWEPSFPALGHGEGGQEPPVWLPMDLVCPFVARWVPETSKSQPCPQGLPVCWRRAWGWGRLMSLTVFWACYREVPGILSGDNCQPRGGWGTEGPEEASWSGECWASRI